MSTLIDVSDATTTEVRCDVPSLLSALAAVAPVVPSKSPKPVLRNVKLSVNTETGTTLTATDLELGVTVEVLGVDAPRPVELILPPDRLRSILEKAVGRSSVVTIAVTDTGSGPSAKITGRDERGKGFDFDLPLEDPGTYPALPGFPASAAAAEVSAADLRMMIARTVFATDPESTRYALGGCLVEAGDGFLALVGTDGRRLARQQVPAGVTDPGKITQAVAPIKALKLLRGLVDRADPPASVSVNTAALHVKTARATVYSRLVEGRFPRYQDAIPQDQCLTGTATGTASQFLWASEAAAIMTSEDTRGVDFGFRKAGVTVRSEAAEKGKGAVESDLEYAGPDSDVTLDPRYLNEALRSLDPSDQVRVRLGDHKTALVLELADPAAAYTYVIMPLTKYR